MSNGDDAKFRSRKWILATRTFWVATIQHAVLQLLVLAAVVLGKIDSSTWARVAEGLGMVWVWAAGIVLGLYGAANVAAIKFDSTGGVGK